MLKHLPYNILENVSFDKWKAMTFLFHYSVLVALVVEVFVYLIEAFRMGNIFYLTVHQYLYLVLLMVYIVMLQASQHTGKRSYTFVLMYMIMHSLSSLFFLSFQNGAKSFDMDEELYYHCLSFVIEIAVLLLFIFMRSYSNTLYFKITLYFMLSSLVVTLVGFADIYITPYEVSTRLESSGAAFIYCLTQLIIIYKSMSVYLNKFKGIYHYFFHYHLSGIGSNIHYKF